MNLHRYTLPDIKGVFHIIDQHNQIKRLPGPCNCYILNLALVVIQVYTKFQANLTISLIVTECGICNSLGDGVDTSPLSIITFIIYGSSLPSSGICHGDHVACSAVGINISTPEPMCPLIQFQDQLVVSPDKICLSSTNLMKLCIRKPIIGKHQP